MRRLVVGAAVMLILCASIFTSAAAQGKPDHTASYQAGTLEERKLVLEQQKLALERERFLHEKDEDEKKHGAEWRQFYITLGGAYFTVVFGVIGIMWNLRSLKTQMRVQSQLKAAELIMAAPYDRLAVARRDALKKLLGDDLLSGFGEHFQGEGIGLGHDADRKEMLKQLLEHPDRRADVVRLWQRLLPGWDRHFDYNRLINDLIEDAHGVMSKTKHQPTAAKADSPNAEGLT